jgi:arylsulfatase A-like enzyme
LRADLVTVDHAPAMAALAAEGTRYTRARSPAGWTLPGFVSLLAGRPAEARLLGARVPDADADRLLPALLRLYGYATAWSFGRTLLADHPDAPRWFGAAAPTAPDLATLAAALPTLPEPFFVLAHDVDLHAGDQATELGGADRPALPAPAAREAARAGYVERLAVADAAVGAFLAALDAAGHRDDTLVVLTSDHGEAFGEHGAMGHGFNLHEEVLRVPLILRGPGVPAGRTDPTPVSTTDLAPTLLTAAGVPVHAEMTGLPLPLAPEAPARVMYARTNDVAAARIAGDEKLLLLPPSCGDDTARPPLRRPTCAFLFDLAADPGETTNLAASAPDRVAAARADLERWLATQFDAASLRESLRFRELIRRHGYFDAADTPPSPHPDRPPP